VGLVKNTCWAIVDKLGQIFAWTCAETPRAAEMRCVAVRGVDGWNETRESQGLQPVLVELVRTAPPCEAHAPASALWAARNRVGTRLDGYVEIFRGRPRMTPTGYWSEARHGCSWVARGQDMAHVRHAFEFLRAGGTLVAIMSPGFEYRSDAASALFRDWLSLRQSADMASWHPLPEGSFKTSGTNVRTVMLTIKRGK